MDEFLRPHGIALNHFHADRFWEFHAARAEAPVQRIETATGIAREPKLLRAGVMAGVYEEGPREWETEELLEEAGT